MKIRTTTRGFEIAEFTDRYNSECSLQKSSLATEDCIWFGVTDPKPQIMVSDAARMGLPIYTTEANEQGRSGWTKFDIPEEVSLSTRMHLTREQVKELLPILQRFVETGELGK